MISDFQKLGASVSCLLAPLGMYVTVHEPERWIAVGAKGGRIAKISVPRPEDSHSWDWNVFNAVGVILAGEFGRHPCSLPRHGDDNEHTALIDWSVQAEDAVRALHERAA